MTPTTVEDDSNPYAPPAIVPVNARSNCPVCGARVGFIRFALPLGYCGNCGNYLAIRNWNGTTWPWSVVLCLIIVTPIAIDLTWRREVFMPTIPLVAIWLLLRSIYDKFAGNLVPAVCWGFVALPDDDRLSSDSETQVPPQDSPQSAIDPEH